MKRVHFYLLTVLFLSLVNVAGYSQFNATNRYTSHPRYYCKQEANLHTGPSNEKPILTKMKKNEYVRVLKAEKRMYGDYWEVYHVASKKTGFVYSKYLVSDPD